MPSPSSLGLEPSLEPPTTDYSRGVRSPVNQTSTTTSAGSGKKKKAIHHQHQPPHPQPHGESHEPPPELALPSSWRHTKHQHVESSPSRTTGSASPRRLVKGEGKTTINKLRQPLPAPTSRDTLELPSSDSVLIRGKERAKQAQAAVRSQQNAPPSRSRHHSQQVPSSDSLLVRASERGKQEQEASRSQRRTLVAEQQEERSNPPQSQYAPTRPSLPNSLGVSGNSIGVGLPLTPESSKPNVFEDLTESETMEPWDAYVVSADVEVAGNRPIARAVAEPFVDEEDEDACLSKKSLAVLGAIIVVMLAVVVTVPVVVTNKSGDPGTSDDPKKDCFETTRELADALRVRQNYTAFVEHKLCPDTKFEVDNVINRTHPYQGSFPPLLAQSNMRVKCGDKGSLFDNCVVSHGETLVLNTYEIASEYGAFDVVFEGIIFEHGWPSFMELRNGGDITFRNCLFRQNPAIFTDTSIIIDYQDQGNQVTHSIRQTVTFESCLFEDLHYTSNVVPLKATDFSDVATFIKASTSANSVIIRDSVFRHVGNDNRGGGWLPGSVISSQGAEVRIEQSCFLENYLVGRRLRSFSASVILMGDDAPSSVVGSDNYVVAEDTSNEECLFVGRMQNDGSLTCIDEADASECLSSMYNVTVPVIW